LPSLVIALLSASVAAITFAITQALTSPDAAEKAVKRRGTPLPRAASEGAYRGRRRMTAPGPEQADLRVVAPTAKTALSSAYSGFRAQAGCR